MTQTAVGVLCDATMRAAARIALHQQIEIEDTGRFTEILRTVIKDNLPSVMREWEDGIKSNIGELWLRQLVNAQANDLGLKAVQNYEEATSENQ